MPTMRLDFVSQDHMVFSGEVGEITAPGGEGMLGILPRHAPFLSLLGSGPLTVRAPEGEKRYDVAGGFVQVVANVVRVVAERATAA